MAEKIEWEKLYQLRHMHSFQVIALIGLLMSAAAHVIMLAIDREVPSFGLIYPTWALIFLFGFLLNLRSHPDEHL